MSKEYIDRESVLKCLADLECQGGDDRERDIGNWLLRDFVPERISKIPVSNVVEVVRCQDCDLSAYPEVKVVWCKRHNKYMPVNGYCNYGERRGDR